MKLSVMSYTIYRQIWIQDRTKADWGRMCRLAQEIGTDGIDVVTLCGYTPAEVRTTLADHGIKPVCYTFCADINHPDETARQPGVSAILQALDDAHTLGARTIMMPSGGREGFTREQSRANYIAGVASVWPRILQSGLTMTFENFPGVNSPFVTAADLLEAVRELPGLKITFDNGNAFSGEDPAASFAACADLVVHAHFKDYIEAPDGMPMLNGRRYARALIGEGDVDHRACLRAMKKAGYAGYINLEYEGNAFDGYEGTRRSAAYLKQILRELDAEAA